MKLIFNICTHLLLCFIIISCGSGRISNLERKPNEAVVFAKIKIVDKDRVVTKSSVLFFEQDLNIGIVPDNNGYIYFKVPVGNKYFSSISVINSSQKLPDTLLTFEVKEGKIYYIGDINFKTNVYETLATKSSYTPGGLIGWAAVAMSEYQYIRPPEIKIEDNFDDAKIYFKSIFPTNEEIYKSIVILDSINIDKALDTLSKSQKRRKMLR